MANLLGVDFGTTALKACLFDENGVRLASESAQYKLITKGEFIEFDAQEFFNVFSTTVAKITSKFKVDAMSVDTQGETLIVLDKDGNPLMNAIIWLDNRAEKQAKDTMMIVVMVSKEITRVLEYYTLILKRSHRTVTGHVTNLSRIQSQLILGRLRNTPV